MIHHVSEIVHSLPETFDITDILIATHNHFKVPVNEGVTTIHESIKELKQTEMGDAIYHLVISQHLLLKDHNPNKPVIANKIRQYWNVLLGSR